MGFIRRIPKKPFMAFLSLSLFLVSLFGTKSGTVVKATELADAELAVFIEEVLAKRYKAVLENDPESLKSLYDLNSVNGLYAYEHQKKKIKYLQEWTAKQGVTFTGIDFRVTLRRVAKKSGGYGVNFSVFTVYSYSYNDNPRVINRFKMGTYHSMDIIETGENRIIRREWYTDPFADSMNDALLNNEDLRKIITEGKPRDFSGLSQRRKDAVAYADKYCGGSLDPSEGFLYNKKYKNYNYSGGDCTNFASQVLYEGGKFRMNGAWGYFKEGTGAWVNADAFKSYLLYSGRASTLAYGTYPQVLKASYLLQPGDIIAYCKKGKAVHIAVVTGADSKGYALVNCHNADRFKVPWDLGWSDKGITFRLIRVHY
ncbi:MAG: amidase domain-containing protein [Clostridia bacterium]|jgi:hypothetical protein